MLFEDIGGKLKKLLMVILVIALGSIATTNYAALIDRGGGLIYDDGIGITWISDAYLGHAST